MKIRIAITILLLSIASISNAQNKFVVKARKAYVQENFAEAIDLGTQAYKKVTRKGKMAKKLKGEMAFITAQSYRLTERYREANEWYDRTVLLDYQDVDPNVLLFNGDMLRMMSEFDKAEEAYSEYLKLVPEDDRAKAGLESIEANKRFAAEKTKHKIENQATINKSQFDMAPTFGDRKLSKLYFTSGREESEGKVDDPRSGEGYTDIFVTELDKKGNWTAPYPVNGEGINTVDNEGAVGFDSRYKKMFFTRCPNEKKMNLGCDIWVSTAKGKKAWNEPTKIEGLKSNDTVSVGHPATIDGKFLIFASDMAGGYGGRDLWYTIYDKKSDSWSAPVNMGPEINTKGNELFPSFGLDGCLFFATDGRPGVGGLDIFRAERVGEENKWENPTNLGMPINSTGNDYSLTELKRKGDKMKQGYFTSERKSVNGEYNPDIFQYWLPPNIYDLKVNVSELGNDDKKIDGVRVVVTGSEGGKWEGYTDESGSVFWDKKPAGDRYVNEDLSYTINIFGDPQKYHEDKDGASFTTVGLDYDQHFVIDMNLLPKKPIRLPEVRYPLAKWELLVDTAETSVDPINSPDSLLFVFDLLEEYPGMVLELSSHTDSRGGNSANQHLSENRAKRCYIYLVEEKGVDPRRIVPVGKGENDPRTVYLKDGTYMATEPVDMEGVETVVLTERYINQFKRSNRDLFEQLHQMNRRTEGKVLQMDFDPETAPEADPSLKKYVRYP